MVFSELLIWRAVKYTLWGKFGGLAQRGGRASLGGVRAGSNAQSL